MTTPNDPQETIKQEKLTNSLKVDEVKRLEKVFDISKESFAYSEAVIKTLEDKSRNNITTVAAISGFAFLVRKPVDLSQYDTAGLSIIGLIVIVVGITYWLHFAATKPRISSMPKPERLASLFEGHNYPVATIKFNFETFQEIYAENIKLIVVKGRYVEHQQIGLGFALVVALVYILFGGIPEAQTASAAPGPTPSSLY